MAMSLPGTSIAERPLPASPFSKGIAAPLFIGYTQHHHDEPLAVQEIGSLSAAVAQYGDSGMMYNALRHFFDNGGFLCYVLSLGPAPEHNWSEEDASQLATRLNTAEVQECVTAALNSTLLVVPEISRLNELEPQAATLPALWLQAWQALNTLAGCRYDLFAMLEAPDDIGLTQQLLEDFSAADGQQAAAWWPRLRTRYRQDNHFLTLSPLPAMAALIQRNDRDRGIWHAPANLPLDKVIGPLHSVVDAMPLLNARGSTLNLIRSQANRGVRPWGCRTLVNDEHHPFRYIQTRLLVNRVEQQLSQLARLFMFEPNTPLTWIKFKGQALNGLRQQWQAGAFCGVREEDAFTLQVGLGETMTAEEVAAGRMNVCVRLALLAPAEFITLRLAFVTQSGDAAHRGE